MTEDPWAAIRHDREQGMSLRTLALKYGISKSYIGEMLSSGQKPDTGQVQKAPLQRTSPPPEPVAQPAQSNNLSTAIAQNFIRMIAKHVTGKWQPNDVQLDPKELKLLADALSQCNKIIVTGEVEDAQEQSPYDIRTFLAKCTPDELMIIQPVMDAVAARDAEKITPIRRAG